MTSNPNLAKESSPHSQSILKIDLKAEQNFGGEGVKKVVVPFKREEDMILLCLSNFLHDFVHDYNLSSMHKRVVKGDSYGLLQSLNIGIRNPAFKIFSYESGSYGDPDLYDDSKFEDDPAEPGSKPFSYLEYFHDNKLEIPMQTGGDREAIQMNPLIDSRGEQDSALDFVDESSKFKLKSEIELNEEREVAASGVHVDVDSEFLTYPLTETFTTKDTYNALINGFSKNADFLGFHSGLNTFIVTYLGSNLGKESPEFTGLYKPKFDVNGEEMRNLTMYNSILCSIDCIAADFKTDSLKKSDVSTEIAVFSDIFSILRLAFVSVFNRMNNDLKIDPLSVLNSNSVLQQFIIYYMLFLNCENDEEFNSVLQKQSGGEGGDEEGEMEDEPAQPPYVVLDKTGPVEIRGYPGEEGVGAYYARPEKKIYVGTESIFITHNNLLTTIARGMFVKLGLWDKFFTGVEGYSKTDGSLYKFGAKEMDMISYDKLMELYPTNPWKRGNFNNELLIMQILILKNLLLEMSPAKTLTFGAKIDDQLKNYLDVFYNNYFINKNQKTEKPPPKFNEDVLNNPNPEASIGSDTASLFSGLEDHVSDDEQVEYPEEEEETEEEMIGGNGEIEMVEFPKKPKEELLEPLEEKEEPVEQKKLESVEQEPKTQFPDSEIIDPGRAPAMPVVFKNLKKMFQNNVYTIQNLQSTRIPPITIPFGADYVVIYTLYELLSYNQTLMHKTGSQYNIPAPAFKFVINNAANIAANINGAKFLYTKKDKDEIQSIVEEVKSITDFPAALEQITEEYDSILSELSPLEMREANLKNLKRQNRIKISEYNELLQIQFDLKTIRNTRLIPCENKKYLIEKTVKYNNETLKKGDDWLADWSKSYKWWFDQCQPLFGLYRNLVRGTFCPTVSMMDAMFNCSIKYGATETKEVGTTHFELKYESEDLDAETQKPSRIISFGGVVLNYNETVGGVEQLNAKIDFDLACIDTKNGVDDVANISTMGMQVAESHDLKASVVYKCIVDKIKDIYSNSYGVSTEEDTAKSAGVDLTNQEARNAFLRDKIDRMWSNVQIYKNKDNFNKLLGSTAIKTFGDFLQECLACMQWGGYVNSAEQFPDHIKSFINDNGVSPIYRSVSEPDKIIPYDQHGNALRFGIQGDRPSGFRSIYILLNGDSGINQQAITGYVFAAANQKPSRSILVARGSSDETNNNIRKDKLRGKVIYTTRELPIVQEDRVRYLKSLQYKKVVERKNLIDKMTKDELVPEIGEPAIQGTSVDAEYKLIKAPLDILSMDDPYKTANYNEWDDYETPRVLSELKKKIIVDPVEAAKAEEKARRQAERDAEREKINSEKATERETRSRELQSMKGEDVSGKEIRKTDKEIAEKRRLMAKTLNPTTATPLEEAEKRRLTVLKKKYPFSGGSSSKRNKRAVRSQMSRRNSKKNNNNNKKTLKRIVQKNPKNTRRS